MEPANSLIVSYTLQFKAGYNFKEASRTYTIGLELGKLYGTVNETTARDGKQMANLLKQRTFQGEIIIFLW